MQEIKSPFIERGCPKDWGFLFSLFKGRYGEAERDFNPFVASDISPWKGQTTPHPDKSGSSPHREQKTK